MTTQTINALLYAPAAGPSAATLAVQQVVGQFPVAAGQSAAGFGGGLTDSGANAVDRLFGATSSVNKQGGGSANLISSLDVATLAAGATITTATGVQAALQPQSGATITTGSAFVAQSPIPAGGGTLTTAIGVQIQGQTQSGVGQAWALYATGASDPSALAGTLSVGSLSVPQATLDVTGAIRSKPVTVAALPAAPVDGMRAFVTDANSTTFAAAAAGSGANHVPVYYDGGTSTWRIG
ncbi:MAG: hypothetical protein WDM91_03995 [Rhizomicrobium sp.]